MGPGVGTIVCFIWIISYFFTDTLQKRRDTIVGPTEALLRVEPSQRVNSTDSFDVVSAASASASVSVVGDTKSKEEEEEEEEEGESDWE